MSLVTTANGVQAEYLMVRGVPPRMIADRLGLPRAEVTALMYRLTRSGEVERYQVECIGRADTDVHPSEAATYLYVRGVTTLRIRQLCDLPLDFGFDVNAKHAYQQKQIERVLEHMSRQLPE